MDGSLTITLSSPIASSTHSLATAGVSRDTTRFGGARASGRRRGTGADRASVSHASSSDSSSSSSSGGAATPALLSMRRSSATCSRSLRCCCVSRPRRLIATLSLARSSSVSAFAGARRTTSSWLKSASFSARRSRSSVSSGAPSDSSGMCAFSAGGTEGRSTSCRRFSWPCKSEMLRWNPARSRRVVASSVSRCFCSLRSVASVSSARARCASSASRTLASSVLRRVRSVSALFCAVVRVASCSSMRCCWTYWSQLSCLNASCFFSRSAMRARNASAACSASDLPLRRRSSSSIVENDGECGKPNERLLRSDAVTGRALSPRAWLISWNSLSRSACSSCNSSWTRSTISIELSAASEPLNSSSSPSSIRWCSRRP